MPVSWTFADLKRNALGVILVVAVLAVMVPSTLNRWANDASPIRSVDPIDATVKSVQGKGLRVYLVSIDNGSSVLIDDDRPHLIGARTKIERVMRENGSIFYRFPE